MLQIVVVFKTGHLKEFALLVRQGNFNGPGPGVGNGVGNCSPVDQAAVLRCVGFHHGLGMAGDIAQFIEPGLAVVIGRLHHQRIAFPMAQGIAHPQANIIRQVLLPVQVNHPV